MNLYQDADGTIPAVLAGQPVGFAKRKSGTVDATQATALSKGTLARWPKTGRRNLANFAQAPASNAGWTSGVTNNGVNISKVGYGIDSDGQPFADMRYAGTPTNGSVSNAYAVSSARVSAAPNDAFNSRLSAKVVGGSLSGITGVKNAVALEDSASVYFGELGLTRAASFDEFVSIEPYGSSSNPALAFARPSVVLVCTIGAPIDVTIRYKGLMFERGAVKTPFQFNYGPNDITENGAPDLWHIYNDGGDSLNANLPAGTYGILSMDINKVIKTESIVLAAQGDINILRNERQLDSIIRTGAFSPVEQREIEDYWRRKFQ